MNLKSTSLFAGLIAGSALALSAFPAQAGVLSFNIGGVGTANEDGSVTFNQDTTLQFTFIESRGLFRSDFGVFDAAKNPILPFLFTEKNPGYDNGRNDLNGDWLGTCPETVEPCTNQFTFTKGLKYFFGITSPLGPQVTQASGDFDEGVAAAPGERPANPPYIAFISNSDRYFRSQVGPGAIGAGVDPNYAPIDTSVYDFFTASNDPENIDGDVQDVIVGARIVPTNRTVPEPATLAGLGLVAGAMTMLRRRKGSQVS
jgi:hypothetical protein